MKMTVPLLDPNAQNLPLEHELIDAFKRVLHSGHFILGNEVEAFEKDLSAFLNIEHAISLSSGTDALLVSLMALDIQPGDEILCPSFTFFATAGSIARLGARPVFVDSLDTSYNIDVTDAKRKITSKTRGIIPVHLFGQSADMDAIGALAKEHHLFVIEDAAQSFGATWGGQKSGTLGDCGTYSFFPSKNLGGFGDGGAVVTHNSELAQKIRMLRNHGMQPKYHHSMVGGNFRLDALQTALLRVKLRHLPDYSYKRAKLAQYYTEHLSQLKGVEKMRGISQACGCNTQFTPSAGASILLPTSFENSSSIWNQYTVRVLNGKRDELKAFLEKCGIGSEIYYPIPLHQQKCFEYLPKSYCPVAEQLAHEVLSLPLWPEMTRSMLDFVISSLDTWLKR